MFQKILIVESLDSVLPGLTTSIQTHFNAKTDIAKDGNSGLKKIQLAVEQETPYNLIITSLNYSNAQRDAMKMGESFIAAARSLQPGVKVLVYSDNVHSYRIHKLFHEHKVNAYVAHGPQSMPEIVDAIKMLHTSEVVFISPTMLPFSKNIPDLDLNEFDVQLLQQLARGKSQPEISDFFITQGINHASVSTIEKRINRLKVEFEAINTINLIALAKDTGII